VFGASVSLSTGFSDYAMLKLCQKGKFIPQNGGIFPQIYCVPSSVENDMCYSIHALFFKPDASVIQ